MILRRGKQPSAVDCFIHENVAVVIARLAINAAKLATRKTGQKKPPARHSKNCCNRNETNSFQMLDRTKFNFIPQ
jgi:hypothetical protein